ncbi:hypothetical protein [Emcibacter sp.]|uniref:hypothetical protein n=1 Tax=Emcibacter sp. TaxID=1979954 RepID=UPI002AA69085|nr:hypothetical protein [Emcibacter sp.]
MIKNKQYFKHLLYGSCVLAAAGTLTACNDGKITLDPDQTVVAACDGSFAYSGPVELESPPFVNNYEAQVRLLKTNDTNVAAATALSPAYRLIAGGSGYTYEVAGGQLVDPCTAGSLKVSALGEAPPPNPPANWKMPKSDHQTISVTETPIKATMPGGVTPTADPGPGGAAGGKLILPGGNGYTAQVTCCPGGAARAYNLSVASSPNMTGMAAVPAVVNCPAAAPVNVTITGSLDNKAQPGLVVLRITDPAAGKSCRLTTRVEPAR